MNEGTCNHFHCCSCQREMEYLRTHVTSAYGSVGLFYCLNCGIILQDFANGSVKYSKLTRIE